MRVRIVRHGEGRLDGMRLGLYQPEQVYDLPSSLAAALVAEGIARLEMRLHERRGNRRQVRCERRTGRDRRGSAPKSDPKSLVPSRGT